jgi:hypothetical protein
MSEPTDDEDDCDLEDDDPDLCDFCGVNNAQWFDRDAEIYWCGECDRSTPRDPKPSDN